MTASTITGAEAYVALRRIHAAMVAPWEWSADTPEAVWAVLESVGFTMPADDTVIGTVDPCPDDPDGVHFAGCGCDDTEPVTIAELDRIDADDPFLDAYRPPLR